jgi:transposase
MDRVRARRLHPYDRQKLHKMKRQLGNQVNSRHARIVLLSGGGVPNREIARLCDCTPQWVRQILHRFSAQGIDGITWFPFYSDHAGQPRVFLADTVERIVEAALSPPKQLIGLNEWSLSKLREYLIEQAVVTSISLEHLRQLLRQRGVRWRRTKTWKESTDPEFVPKWRAIRRLYRRPPQNGRVICVDEFGPLNLQPRHGTCLARQGKVTRYRATYKRTLGVRHFLAYYDLKTDRLYGYVSEHKKTPDFLRFLKWIRQRYPRSQCLHMVMDNYGTHLSQDVAAWARTHNVRLYFTPTNASWLNRIECHFGPLKKFALNSSDHRSHAEQEAAIMSYLTWRNRRRTIGVQSLTKARNYAA